MILSDEQLIGVELCSLPLRATVSFRIAESSAVDETHAAPAPVVPLA